jgi:hypothetical protein
MYPGFVTVRRSPNEEAIMSVSMIISIYGTKERQIDNIPWTQGMSGQDAMERAYHGGDGYSFALQYFGQALGYEVIAIDAVGSQSGSDLYLFWEFSLNGKIASQGIDETILNDGDSMGWNYTAYQSARHSTTRYAKIKQIVQKS